MDSGRLRCRRDHERIAWRRNAVIPYHNIPCRSACRDRDGDCRVAPAGGNSSQAIELNGAVGSLRTSKTAAVNRDELVLWRGVHQYAVHRNARNSRICDGKYDFIAAECTDPDLDVL